MSEQVCKQTEALISLGVAYAINCAKGMKVHKKAGTDAGLSVEKMNSALAVAAEVLAEARGITNDEAEKLFDGKVLDGACCPKDSVCGS